MATKTDAQSSAPHVADSHDLIRVQGARVNNLKDVSVEIPKRRLTVFTGVSGSGKSSLVFGTIAAESQRLINETYSAFVQGFMPTLARPEVDAAGRPDDGDHRRPGADGVQPPLHRRHRHRRQRDAAHPLQPAREAAHRLAQRVLVQRPLGDGPAVRSPSSAAPDRTKTEKATFTRLGGMCPRCEGMGSVTDFDLSALYDDSLVAQRGRAHDPRLQHGRLVRPHLPRLPASSTRTSRSASTPRRNCTTCSTRSRPRSRSTGST